MAKTIKPEQLSNSLNAIFERFSEATKEEADRALRAAIIKTWGDIILATPVDTGRARGAWFITTGSPSRFRPNLIARAFSRVTGRGSISGKGPEYIALNTAKGMLGKKWFLTNNMPYIETLEFGGYGTGGEGEGKVTAQGFSKQAPNGMVRINLAKFPRTLRKTFKAFTGGLV